MLTPAQPGGGATQTAATTIRSAPNDVDAAADGVTPSAKPPSADVEAPWSQRPAAAQTGRDAGARAATAGLGWRKPACVAAMGLALLGAGTGLGYRMLTDETPAPPSPLALKVQAALVRAQARAKPVSVAPLAELSGLTEEELLRSVGSASLSVTSPAAQRVPFAGGSAVVRAKTQLTVSLEKAALRFNLQPAVRLELEGRPDVDISAIVFHFNDGRFSVAAQGTGPDALYTAIATAQANKHLRAFVPAALTSGHFDPTSPAVLKLVGDVLALTKQVDPALAAPEHLGAVHLAMPEGGLQAEARLSVTPVADIVGHPRPDLTVRIPAGTPLTVRARGHIGDAAPAITSVSIGLETDAAQFGAFVRKGDNPNHTVRFRRLDAERAPDGQVAMRSSYQLVPFREIADGAVALVNLVRVLFAGAAAAQGARVGDVRELEVPPFENHFEEVDAGVAALGPRVDALLTDLVARARLTTKPVVSE